LTAASPVTCGFSAVGGVEDRSASVSGKSAGQRAACSGSCPVKSSRVHTSAIPAASAHVAGGPPWACGARAAGRHPLADLWPVGPGFLLTGRFSPPGYLVWWAAVTGPAAIIVLGLIAHMALSRHDTPDATVPNSGAAAYARVPVQRSPVVSHRRISSPRRADDSPNRRAGARA
jgi:hypothetical protein